MSAGRTLYTSIPHPNQRLSHLFILRITASVNEAQMAVGQGILCPLTMTLNLGRKKHEIGCKDNWRGRSGLQLGH